MKFYFPILFILFYNKGVAQIATPSDLSKTYQDRAFWFQKAPQYNKDSVLYYFDRAERFLGKQQPTPYKAFAELYKNRAEYTNAFHFFMQTGEYATKAWSYWEKMTDEEKKDNLLTYSIQFCLAVTQLHEGQVKKGLDIFEKNYELCRYDSRPEVQARLLKDKGYFYGHHNVADQFETAISFFHQSLKIYEQLDSVKYADAKLRIYTNLIRFYHKLGKDSLSEVYFKKMDESRFLARNPYISAFRCMEKGEYLINLKEYAKAENSIKESMAGLEQYNMVNTNYYQHNLSLLGTIAREKGQYDKAISYYNRSKEISAAINYKDWVIENLLNLSVTYERKGDFRQALSYQKQYAEAKLNIQKERTEKGFKEYELQRAITNKEDELTQQRNKFWATISILILVLGAGVWLYRLTLQLRKRNEEKEFLIKEVHHRVKNNLQVLSSLLRLQSKHIKDENALEAVREGQNRVEAMGLIHQKLYMGDNLAAVEMQDYLKNLGDTLLYSFGYDDDSVTIKYDIQPLHLDVDTAIPLGLVINELITNSLKYAFPKNKEGVIILSLWVNDLKNLCLKIEDNGVGKADVPQLKNSTSFGTNLVQILSKKLRGKLEVLAVEKGYATFIEFAEFKLVTV